MNDERKKQLVRTLLENPLEGALQLQAPLARVKRHIECVARRYDHETEKRILALPVAEDPEIKTFGWKQGEKGLDLTIRFAPAFVDGVPEGMLGEMVKHEIEHRLFELGRLGPKREKWDLAKDFAVNEVVIHAGNRPEDGANVKGLPKSMTQGPDLMDRSSGAQSPDDDDLLLGHREDDF